MPKFKIKKTDILHDKKVYPEGSEIELTNDEVIKLKDFLIPLSENKPAKTSNNKANSKKENKAKAETKPKEAEPKKETPEGNGGEN